MLLSVSDKEIEQVVSFLRERMNLDLQCQVGSGVGLLQDTSRSYGVGCVTGLAEKQADSQQAQATALRLVSRSRKNLGAMLSAETNRLHKLPDDAIAATTILVEIGNDMTRFGSADGIAFWSALCPANNESAGK